MLAAKVTSLSDLADPAKEEAALQTQLQQNRAAEQKIASQNFFGRR